MTEEVFEKEIAMCCDLNKKNGGKCAWGECKTCGVIPLLYKIHKGIFLETEEEISRVKKEIFEGT